MKKSEIRKNIHSRVRLRPKACSVLNGRVVDQRDDIWVFTNVTNENVVVLRNMNTGHVAKLGKDHIHHYDTDPNSEIDGFKHGFLMLTVQIFMSGSNLWVEPIPLNSRKFILGRQNRNLRYKKFESYR